MKAALYARVSTEDQEREGSSLGTQEEACRKYAEEQGYEVQDAYVIKEVYSGLTLERPELERLRSWVSDKEIDGVVVYSTDRLSRDPVHLLLLVEEIDKKGVTLHFVTEPLDNSMEGQLLSFVRGWASKLEALKIKERTVRGKRARALSGKLPGNSHARLYGYYYIPGKGVGEGVRYINEAESEWVKRMFLWLVEEGLSTNAITYKLRDLGAPTPSGKGFWLRRTVQRILKNTAYYGKTYAFTQTCCEPKHRIKPNAKDRKTGVIWKPKEEWLEIPNATPPIISEELFEAAQKQLQRNRELSLRNAKNHYLLRGHIYCRQCGRGYWAYCGNRTRATHHPAHPFYRCSGKLRIVAPVKCGNRSVSANAIETMVWGQIKALLAKPELIMAELQRRQQEASEVTTIERALQRVDAQLVNQEKQKARAWKAFELTGDEKEFKANISKLGEEVKVLEEEKFQLEKRIEANKQFRLGVGDIKRACELVRLNLKGVTFEDKRSALEALQVKVWIDGDNVDIEGVIPIPAENVESSVLRPTPLLSTRTFR